MTGREHIREVVETKKSSSSDRIQLQSLLC